MQRIVNCIISMESIKETVDTMNLNILVGGAGLPLDKKSFESNFKSISCQSQFAHISDGSLGSKN